MVEHPIFKPNLGSWLTKEATNNDVIISSRIRLSRNLSGYIFPIYKHNRAIIEQVNQSLPDDYTEIKMSQITSLQRNLLLEKHLISYYLIHQTEQSAVFINSDENISIMINEEDHICIQCLTPGLNLFRSLHAAFKIENSLEKKGINFAFDKKLGYLTSCINNLGTAMRASVTVHLPGLVATNNIRQVIEGIRSLGFVVKGTYDEDVKTMNDIFQIANQITLGKTEEEIIEDLTQIIDQLIIEERAARINLKQKYPVIFEDQIFRAYGLLKNCRIISNEESAEATSTLRLGLSLGFLEPISYPKINELILFTKPAFLRQAAGKDIEKLEEKATRAYVIRTILEDL